MRQGEALVQEAEHEVENLASNANFFAVGAKAVVGTAARVRCCFPRHD